MESPERIVEDFRPRFLGKLNESPNPQEYKDGTMYKDTRTGTVYIVENGLWESLVEDGKQGAQGAQGRTGAAGSGTGVKEVESIVDKKLEAFQTDSYKDEIVSGEIGFNAYFMFTEYLRDITSADNGTFDYLSACNAKVLRTLYPVFSKSEFLQYVFSNGIPDRDYVDGDFESSFLTKSDWLFDLADSKNVKLHLGCFWDISETASMGNETVSATAYSSKDTNTAKFMARFSKYIASRYNGRSSLYAISLCNEWQNSKANYPSAAQLGEVFGNVASEVHLVNKNVIVTANMDTLLKFAQATRKTIDTYISELDTVFKDLDMWCIHLYMDRNYIGYSSENAGGSITPISGNNYGYEFADYFVESICNAARRQGKELCIGEFGVSRATEIYTDTMKKRRILNAVRSAKYSLLWNILPEDRAIVYNTPLWYIDPYTDTTWKNLVLEIGKVKKEPTQIIFPSYSRKQPVPKEFFKCSTSANNGNGIVQFTSTAKLSAADNLASMFWIRVDSQLSALQGILSFAPSNTTGIIWIGANSQDGSIYNAYRISGSSIGSGSTAGNPILSSGTWYHIAAIPKPFSPFACDLFLNGVYWNSFVLTSATKGLTIGTCIVGAGGTGGADYGAPCAFQDITLIPNASFKDVYDNMNGEFNPKSVLHMRVKNGLLEDISNTPITLTVGSQVTKGYSS